MRLLQGPLAGALLMVAAMNVVPLMDGIAKYLSADYPVLMIVWGRFFFHALWLAPAVLASHGWRALRVAQPGLQALRSLCILASTGFFFAAIKWLPIPDALALLFVSPLLVTLVVGLVYGERVGALRWLAVAMGFCGVLLVVRPGAGVFHWASLLGLGAGASYAAYLLVTRHLSAGTPALVTLFYTGLVGALLMSLLLPLGWHTPTPAALGLLLLIGLIAAIGHALLLLAFRRAPAATLAPLSYTEIVTATAVSWFAFGDFPDAWSWLGIAVIVASGLVTSFAEHRESRRIPSPAS